MSVPNLKQVALFVPKLLGSLGMGRPKFNQLETVTTFTYRPSVVKIDTHNFELL